MKDEPAGEPIKEFVGIRSKMHSFVSGSHEQKKIKGIAKPVIKRDLRFQMYKDTIKDEQIRLARTNTIRSFQHQLSCQTLNKVSLSPFDDKRYLIDLISSLPYGHYKIKQHQLSKLLSELPNIFVFGLIIEMITLCIFYYKIIFINCIAVLFLYCLIKISIYKTGSLSKRPRERGNPDIVQSTN